MRQTYFFALVTSLFALISVTARGQLLRTVALSDDAAPGTAADVSFFNFDPPVLNSLGQVAFNANLSGSSIDNTNREGIWSEGSGMLDLVVRQGEIAPGVPGQLPINGLVVASLNTAGQTVFRGLFGEGVGIVAPGLPADVPPFPIFRHGLWKEGATGIELIARSGDAVPGAPAGTKFLQVGFSVIGDTGNMVLLGRTLNGTFADGDQESSFFLYTPGMDTTPIEGVSHVSALTPTGEITALGSAGGILSGPPDGLNVVVQSGDLAPNGEPFGRIGFSDFSGSTRIGLPNTAGLTVFNANTGSGFFDSGIWKEDSGDFTLVVGAGQQVPGAANGVTFYGRSFDQPVVNTSGEIAFRGKFTDNPDTFADGQGIWSDAGGSLSLIALEGDVAPGTNGMVFSEDFSTFDDFIFSTPSLNAAGQVAFLGVHSGVSQNGNHRGIWATDHDGTLQLIATTGGQLTVGPGDLRTVEWLGLGSFNDLGQVAYAASFSDGSSGVFVSNLVAVPEPTTGLLLFASISLLATLSSNQGAVRRRQS